MDVKITKKRFVNLIGYDLVKIILAIVAAVVVWVLLFTTCATRATVGEQFYFVMFDDVYANDGYSSNVLNELKKDGKLSYDVLNAYVSNVTSAGNYSALYMLSLKASTKEGDVIMFNGKNEEAKNEDGTVKTDETGAPVMQINQSAQSIVNNNYLVSFIDYLDSAKNYLDRFVTDGVVNEKAVEEYFLSVRLKEAGNYRKTYRTDEQKAEGVKKEIERIKTLNETYSTVISAIENAAADGVDLYWYADFAPSETYEKKHVAYGMDLYKLNARYAESGGKKITDYWYYWETEKDSNGNDQQIRSGEGLVLSVFNFGSDQPDLQFESLAVIEYAIKNFSDYAN